MALIDRLNTFRAGVAAADGLIVAAHQVDAATAAPLWSLAHRQVITQAAFLSAYIAWESFLEGVFSDYMRGLPSAAGNSFVRYCSPRDDAHCSSMLIGSNKYVDYSNPDILRKLAKLYLQNGAPLEGVLAAIHGDLFDLKTVRNAAAHLSSTTSAPLDALASRKLGAPVANITVYDFILRPDPNAPGATILQSYLAQLDNAANAVVHA
jgi:hypothetical protein